MDCPEKCGCDTRITRNEEDIKQLWKSINRMIGWVITSSGAVIVFVLTILINFLSNTVFKP